MDKKLPYPPDPTAVIAALNATGISVAKEAGASLLIFHKAIVKLMDALEESGDIVVELCKMMADIKAVLDENKTHYAILMEKYPEESVVEDLIELNGQLVTKIAADIQKVIEMVAINVTKD